MKMAEETVSYATYIKTDADTVWKALTTSEFTRQYFWGANVESDWKPGSTFRGFMDDGTTFMNADILEAEPGKTLSYNFRMVQPDGSESEESKVTFSIEPMGEMVRLVVTHEKAESHKDALMGWEMSMSSLKSLLETGNALAFG